MAIECLEEAIRLHGKPMYVYHEIVHNRWVVDHFKDEGVVFVDDLDEVPEGSWHRSAASCEPSTRPVRW
jgi:4-hydroxy-3-methylbut-2-enyl diphosphate reductase